MNENGPFSPRLNTISNFVKNPLIHSPPKKYSSPIIHKKIKLNVTSINEYLDKKRSMKNLKTHNNNKIKELNNYQEQFKFNNNHQKSRNFPVSPPSLLPYKTSPSLLYQTRKNLKFVGKKISQTCKFLNNNTPKKSYQLTESTNTLTFNSSSLKNSCISPKTCKNNIRFVRKIDVELNSLLTNKKQKKFHFNFFNKNYRIINKLKKNQGMNTLTKNSIDYNSNYENETKYSSNYFNSVKKKNNSKFSEKGFNNVLNNLSRNVIYINQKNKTVKNDTHTINMLKDEKYNLIQKLTKFLIGDFQLKNFAHYSKEKGENNILPLINKYTQKLNIPLDNINSEEHFLKLISDYITKNKNFFENKKEINNFDLKANYNENLDQEHNIPRKSIIYDRFIINQCVKALIPDDYKPPPEIDNTVDPFAKYDNKKEKIFEKKNDLSNISSSIENSSSSSSSEISISNSASSMHERINMNYRNDIIHIFDGSFSPKEIITENGKKRKIKYKLIKDKNKNEKYVPCYEDGTEIKNEKILFELFKSQKNKENKNNVNLSVSLSEEDSESEIKLNSKQKTYKMVRSKPKLSSDILTTQNKHFKKILKNKKNDNINYNNKAKKKVSFVNDIKEKDKIQQNNRMESNRNLLKKFSRILAKHSSKKPKNIENYNDYNKEINEKLKEKIIRKQSLKEKSIKKNEIEQKILFQKRENIIKEKHNESSDFSKLFESSSEENIILSENEPKNPEYLIKKKLLRSIEKKRNKAIKFLILLIKQKEENIYEKSQLIELLSDKDIRKCVDYLKEKINEGRANSASSFLNDEIGPATDEEVINYLFRCFTDKNSPYYKMIHDSDNDEENELKKFMERIRNNKSFNFLFIDSFERNVKKKSSNLNLEKSIGTKKEENRFKRKKPLQKKIVKKKNKIGSLNYDFFRDIDEERKIAASNEVSLKNEIKYQIKITENDEGKQRFQILLQQIENLKKLDVNSYIKSIKDNYSFYKGEIRDLVEAREMEERLNIFAENLSLERIAGKYVRSKLKEKLKIKDNMFQSSMCDINKSDNEDNNKK